MVPDANLLQLQKNEQFTLHCWAETIYAFRSNFPQIYDFTSTVILWWKK